MNSRTRLRLFISLLSAFVIFLVSDLSAHQIVAWLIALWAVDVCCHQLRSMASRLPDSRLDVFRFAALHVSLYTAWSFMPLVLGFGGLADVLISLLTLMGVLISAAQTAVQVPVCLLSLVVVSAAMLAPDLAHVFGHAPHAGAGGVLIIKILFLLNFASLVRSWYANAKLEARLRAELAFRRQQAEDLAAAKAMFLAHMSHEIRSPLAGVTLLASVLKRLEGVPEDQRQMIEQIDAGGQAILNLLNAVLDYSKIEAGKITLQSAPVNPTALLDSVTGFFALAARDANIKLSLSIDGELPAALMLDETRTRQIITNLVGNAIKHSSGATVLLTAAYRDGGLLVEVVDTGKGVAADLKAHLFAPHEHQNSAESGTGLGLAISRGLVSLMAGEIGFRDTRGGGATFWFRIPASPAARELG